MAPLTHKNGPTPYGNICLTIQDLGDQSQTPPRQVMLAVTAIHHFGDGPHWCTLRGWEGI